MTIILVCFLLLIKISHWHCYCILCPFIKENWYSMAGIWVDIYWFWKHIPELVTLLAPVLNPREDGLPRIGMVWCDGGNNGNSLNPLCLVCRRCPIPRWIILTSSFVLWRNYFRLFALISVRQDFFEHILSSDPWIKYFICKVTYLEISWQDEKNTIVFWSQADVDLSGVRVT